MNRAALAVVILLALGGCGPSCEERGGTQRMVASVPMLVGNTVIPNNIYECDLPKFKQLSEILK